MPFIKRYFALFFVCLLILCILLIWGIYFGRVLTMKNGSDQVCVCVWLWWKNSLLWWQRGRNSTELNGQKRDWWLCLSSVIATWNLTKMWTNLECSTDHLLCVRVRTVVKVYVLLNSILLVQYCLIHVYGSRLTSEYMK